MTAADPNGEMIRTQLVARGVTDARVLAAFRSVPRELFVPALLREEAWADHPLPLGHGQTISQPYIVALMTSLLKLNGTERVLEVGTGSGYQTALLARLSAHVYSAEIEPALSLHVPAHLAGLGISNVTLRGGDALHVFSGEAPFDAILAAAAPDSMPEALLEQLGEGGRCVLPVGAGEQYLWLVERRGGVLHHERLAAVRFVPMRSAADLR